MWEGRNTRARASRIASVASRIWSIAMRWWEELNILTDGTEALFADARAGNQRVGPGVSGLKGPQRYVMAAAWLVWDGLCPRRAGAAVADPKHTMICLTGDGSLHMNVHELQTVAPQQPET